MAENAKKNFFTPQCGLAPGFINMYLITLCKSLIQFIQCRMSVGALPLNVSNTLQYGLTWSTEGLINEYAKPCEGIVDGEKRTLALLVDIEKLK